MANVLKKIGKYMMKPMREHEKATTERNRKISSQVYKKDPPTPAEISNDGYVYEGGVK